MDFKLTKEQEFLKETAAQFAARYCEPEAAELDETHRFPMETWKKMAELGLLRVNHSEKYGGTGYDSIGEMIVIEELSKASLSHGAAYALLAHGFPSFIEKFGTEEQKQQFVPQVLNEGVIGSFCLTEPDAGSDATGIHTTSTRDGDGYILNGTKCFITAGNLANTIWSWPLRTRPMGSGASTALLWMPIPRGSVSVSWKTKWACTACPRRSWFLKMSASARRECWAAKTAAER